MVSPMSIVNSHYKKLSKVICLVASVLCIGVWYMDKSIYLDEANLIRNIYELSYLELVGPLQYGQSAPFLYSWLVKTWMLLLGNGSYAIRLTSLFFVISSLWFMRSLVVNKLIPKAGLLVLTYYAIHEMVVRYGTECKQYSADLFVTTALLWLVSRYPLEKSKSVFIWSVAGVMAEWLSMPSLFLLTAIGIYWLIQENGKPTLSIIGIGGVWLIGFLLNYYYVLEPGMNSTQLQNFHGDYFIDFTDSSNVTRNLLTYVRLIAKKTMIGMTTVIVLFFLGFYSISKHSKNESVIYIVPIALSIILSSLGMYSLLERLLLFLLPILLLILGHGTSYLLEINVARKWKHMSYAIVTISLLIAMSHREGIKWLYKSPVEDLKSPILEIEKSDDNHPRYITKLGYTTYDYYSTIANLIKPKTIIKGTKQVNIHKEIYPLMSTCDTMWIVISHMQDIEREKELLKMNFKIEKTVKGYKTYCIMITNPIIE